MQRKTAILAALLPALLLTGVGIGFAASPFSGTSGTITILAAQPSYIASATIGSTGPVQNCTISGTGSFACPDTTLGQSVSEIIQLQIDNPANIAVGINPPTWTFSSTGTNESGVLLVTTSIPNGTTIQADSSVVISIGVIGLSAQGGTDSFTIEL